MSGVVTYAIDGRKIKSPRDFYTEIGRAVNGDGGYFGSNLDALADCLRGGFGTPDGGFRFEWRHSASARARLASQDYFARILAVFADEGIELDLR